MFFSTFGGGLIYLTPCNNLDFHCQFTEKPDKCQYPMFQDIQAYLVIARTPGSPDFQKGNSLGCFIEFYCTSFISMIDLNV